MDKNKLPYNFNMAMVLMDMIPVIFFAIGMIHIGTHFPHLLFYVGAALCVWAGIGKVLWKLFIVVKKVNIPFFYKQLRYFMSAGFLLMILSMVVYRHQIQFIHILAAVCSMPCSICFIIGCCLMGVMIYCAKHLDPNDAKSNWIEQSVNVVAQGMFMLGILLIR